MSTLVLLPAQVLDREQGRSLLHATDDAATQVRLVYALRNAHIVYRAMVGAMVARLRAMQVATDEARTRLLADYCSYVELATNLIQAPQPAIVITHALPGCGKDNVVAVASGSDRCRTDPDRCGAQARARHAAD